MVGLDHAPAAFDLRGQLIGNFRKINTAKAIENIIADKNIRFWRFVLFTVICFILCVGAGGANLHYIRNETGAIATLRGRGSLFIDPAMGTESPEPMHLYIEHARFEGLQSAKQLAKNLIETMQQELAHYQQTNPPVPPVQFASQQAQLNQSSQILQGQIQNQQV